MYKRIYIISFIALFGLGVAGTAYAISIESDFDLGNANYLHNAQGLSIGTTTVSSGALIFPDGTIQTTAYLGSAQTISAANVSSGEFGSNTGGGNFSFPAALDVTGLSTFTDSVRIQDPTGSDYLFLNNTSVPQEWVFQVDGEGKLNFKDETAGTSRMLLTSAGHLALGTTDVDAIASSWRALRVAQDLIVAGRTAANQASLGINYYPTGTNQDDYRASTVAAQILMTGGEILLRVAPSGTADTAITWEDVLTLPQTAQIKTSRGAFEFEGTGGFSGTGDGIYRPSTGEMGIVVGGSPVVKWKSGWASLQNAVDMIITSGAKYRLDGSGTGNTYIYEASADQFRVVAGGNTSLGVDSGAVFSPAANADLGKSGSRWPTIYGVNANLTGTLDMNSNLITNLGTPTAGSHAATKQYVDDAVTGGGEAGNFTTLSVSGTSTLAETSGNVGVGTTTPSQKLHVAGNALVDGGNIYNNNTNHRWNAAPPWNYFYTQYGYIALGPANTSWAHIYTDRPGFYFNKGLYVLGSLVWNQGNDGAGSGLDADTVDGITGGSFIRSDASDNVSGHTEWQDTWQVRLGSGADMRMRHDGTNTTFYNFTGNWYQRNLSHGNQIFFQGEDAGGTNRALLYMDPDGRVGSRRVEVWGLEVNTDFNVNSSNATIQGNTIWHAGNDGSGSGLSADNLDGINSSGFVRGDGTNNGSVVITSNDADFIVRDSSDTITNYIWRDHSASRLYLGTSAAVPSLRANLDMNGNTIADVGQINFTGGESIQDGTNLLFSSNSGYMDFRPTDGTHGLIIRDFDGSSTAWSGIRTQDDGSMELRADGASYSQLVLADDGDVGIGTTNPGAKLEVAGGNITVNRTDANAILNLDTTSTNGAVASAITHKRGGVINWWIGEGGNGNIAHFAYDDTGTFLGNRLIIQRDTGNVGIGINPGGSRLQVVGLTPGTGEQPLCWGPGFTGSSEGAVVSPGSGGCSTGSSITLKENLRPMKYGLDDVMKLQPRLFSFKNYKEGEGRTRDRIGFIAEEMEKVVPEVIFYDQEDGSVYGIAYEELTALLAKGIQELKAEDDELRAENDELKAEDDELRTQIQSLRERIEALESK